MHEAVTVLISGDSITAARELYAEYNEAAISEDEMQAKDAALQTALSVLYPQGLPHGIKIELCPDQGYTFRVDVLRRMLDVLGLSRLIIGGMTCEYDETAEAMRRC